MFPLRVYKTRSPRRPGGTFSGSGLFLIFAIFFCAGSSLFYNGSLSDESLRYGALIGLGGMFLVAYIFRVIDKRRFKQNK